MNLYKIEKENQVQARMDSAVPLSLKSKPSFFSESHPPLSSHSMSEPEHPAIELSYEPLFSNKTLRILLAYREIYWRHCN